MTARFRNAGGIRVAGFALRIKTVSPAALAVAVLVGLASFPVQAGQRTAGQAVA